jgi:hypothetical protein
VSDVEYVVSGVRSGRRLASDDDDVERAFRTDVLRTRTSVLGDLEADRGPNLPRTRGEREILNPPQHTTQGSPEQDEMQSHHHTPESCPVCSIVRRMGDRVRFYERAVKATRITAEQQERIWSQIEPKLQ